MQSQDFTYKTDSNGEPLLATAHWATSPPHANETSKPIVLILHLGGFMVGSKDTIAPSQIAYLTSLNFLVLIPNYRLCPQVSARDGAYADAVSALDFARDALPSQLSAHNVKVDPTRIVAMGHSAGGTLSFHLASQPNPPKAIAAFYPSLYLSDPESTMHKPYAAWASMPTYEPTPENEDAIWNRPSGAQISAFPLALPGTVPKPRNVWQMSSHKTGIFMQTIQPDGDYKAIDPCTKFVERGKEWPPTLIVQGDEDDVPGSGVEYMEHAVRDLKEAGAEKVELQVVPGAPHGFDLFPGNGVGEGEKGAIVKRALDFLRAEV